MFFHHGCSSGSVDWVPNFLEVLDKSANVVEGGWQEEIWHVAAGRRRVQFQRKARALMKMKMQTPKCLEN